MFLHLHPRKPSSIEEGSSCKKTTTPSLLHNGSFSYSATFSQPSGFPLKCTLSNSPPPSLSLSLVFSSSTSPNVFLSLYISFNFYNSFFVSLSLFLNISSLPISLSFFSYSFPFSFFLLHYLSLIFLSASLSSCEQSLK